MTGDRSARERLWVQWGPVSMLLAVIGLSLVLAVVASRYVAIEQRTRFQRAAGTHTQALREQLSHYEDLLLATRATLTLRPDLMPQADFASYARRLNLIERYPGVQALGFNVWIPDGQVAPVLAELRRKVRPEVTIRRNSPAPLALAPISVIAPPTSENLRVLGFDMYSEATRRDAFDRARRLGGMQATRPVQLVQRDNRGRSLQGFLLVLPVWDSSLEQLDGGREKLRGYVYLAVRTDEFLSSLEQTGVPGQLVARVTLGAQSMGRPVQIARPAFRKVQELSVAGQPWTVQYAATGNFGRGLSSALPMISVVLGLLIGGLSYWLTQAQVSGRRRAEALNQTLAQARTQQAQARAEFEAIFQSMQDAAVFTDPSGHIRRVNRAMGTLFRQPLQQLMGEPLAKLHLDRRLESRSTFQALTTPYRREDGTVFPEKPSAARSGPKTVNCWALLKFCAM
ncbi:CHASE domain-containing protein [Deinococcus malanensis]|uniref:CHASE domain-containing protein n=1 Tax=Deinococcus malanensis TaxID=1706855 RepID=UPI003645E205